MAAKNRGVKNCIFDTTTGQLDIHCKKCNKLWWTAKRGDFRCSCGQLMVVAYVGIKIRKKSTRSLFFHNDNPIWKEAIDKYLCKKEEQHANLSKV